MMRRSFIRRLERLEARLAINREHRFLVQFYNRSPDGTLIRLPDSDEDGTEADYRIRVTFVSPPGSSA